MSVAEALPHWDLSNVYPTLESEEFKRGLADLSVQLDDLERYLDAHHMSPMAMPESSWMPNELGAALGGYLTRTSAIRILYSTLGAYISSFVATDSRDTLANRLRSELQVRSGVRGQQLEVRFQGWLGTVAGQLPAALAADSTAAAHAFYLQEMAEQSRYLMSQSEENLATELSLSGGAAWNKLQGTVTSQLVVPFERQGQVEKLPIPALLNVQQHDPDEAVRRRAYDAEMAAWDTVKEPLAACLNGVKGMDVVLNKKRGRQDALHTSLDNCRIDRETLDAMLTAMRDSFPMFRRYFKHKARLLGKEQLAWWDLFAPLGKNDRMFTWAETRAYIIAQFGRFSPRLANFAQRAFDQRWIDAEQRAGKRGGAFCMGVPGVDESRILCNFDGSLDQVFTVAHELGHAFHNECQAGRTAFLRGAPMTLAETASIFCETIVTEAVLAEASSREEELATLETNLQSAAQVVVDIYSRYLFESEVYVRRATAELAADDFCAIMLQAQADTYGDGLQSDYRHKYMWTWKPHYYSPGFPFYNYPYAFGLLFGTGLYALYQARGAAFVPEYETLLTSTNAGTAADLAAQFGINIRQPDFWRASLAVIGKRVDRFCAL